MTLDLNIDQKNDIKEDEEEDDEFSLELDNTTSSYSTENLLQNAINNYRSCLKLIENYVILFLIFFFSIIIYFLGIRIFFQMTLNITQKTLLN